MIRSQMCRSSVVPRQNRVAPRHKAITSLFFCFICFLSLCSDRPKRSSGWQRSSEFRGPSRRHAARVKGEVLVLVVFFDDQCFVFVALDVARAVHAGRSVQEVQEDGQNRRGIIWTGEKRLKKTNAFISFSFFVGVYGCGR